MFKDKHIVISGGSSGLGLALAQAYAGEGARLTLLGRNPARLEHAVDELRARHTLAQIQSLALDVSNSDAVRPAIKRLAQQAGGIDMLINNAGVLREGYFETLDDAVFRSIMDINFHGLVHMTRAALPFLKASEGRLVNIASVAGLTGSFGYSAYAAAKHAVVGFTDCLYFELQPQGVRVHLVCPAEFDSPMVEELDRYRTPENREHTLTIPKVAIDTIVNGTIKGIRSGRYRIVPGTAAWLATIGLRLFPDSSRKVGESRIRKVYRGPIAAPPRS